MRMIKPPRGRITDMGYRGFLDEHYKLFSGRNGGFVFQNDYFNERERLSDESQKLHTNLLPTPVLGDLDKGKIFICSLNPGFKERDYEDEKIISVEVMIQFSQRNASMFFLGNDYNGTDGSIWWKSRFNQKDPNKSLVMNVLRRYQNNGVAVDIADIYAMLSRIVVALELFPYHSGTMNWRAMQGCEQENGSVYRMRSFVHNELIPNAGKNNQIVCFTRSIKAWGVTEEEKQMTDVVYCTPSNASRRITFSVEKPMGAFILDHIRVITGSFSKVL